VLVKLPAEEARQSICRSKLLHLLSPPRGGDRVR
jgi:hypothetical protein